MTYLDEQFDTQVVDPVTPNTGRTKRIAIGALAIVVALAIGGAIGYGATQQQVDDAEAQAAKDVAAAEDQADTQVAAAETRADNEIAAAEAAMKGREDAIAQRETDVAAKEAAVAGREAAVTTTEQAIDASQIQPGTYLVPEELTAGRYRTINDVNGNMCYMSQDKGSDIVNNLLEESGRPVFTVVDSPGTTFTIDSDCGPVQKI